MTIDLRHVDHLSLVWKGASPSGRAPAESQSSGFPDAHTVVVGFVTETSFDEVAAIGLSVGAPGSVATGLAAARASARDSAANGLAGARQRAEAFIRGGSTVSGGVGGSATALAVRTGGTRSSFSSSDDRVRTTSTFRGVKVEASSGERAFGLAVAVGAGGVGAAGAMGVTLATVMTEAWGGPGSLSAAARSTSTSTTMHTLARDELGVGAASASTRPARSRSTGSRSPGRAARILVRGAQAVITAAPGGRCRWHRHHLAGAGAARRHVVVGAASASTRPARSRSTGSRSPGRAARILVRGAQAVITDSTRGPLSVAPPPSCRRRETSRCHVVSGGVRSRDGGKRWPAARSPLPKVVATAARIAVLATTSSAIAAPREAWQRLVGTISQRPTVSLAPSWGT